MKKDYRICKKCIMDTSDKEIIFDEKGICNHCYEYDLLEKKLLKGEKREQIKNDIVKEIKNHGKNKEYDCIMGISGGVDSTYLAYIVKGLGLRPLAVHFDNGWNSEFAVANIENALKKLDIDFFTHVVDWEEFKDLQLSYFKAGVVNLEVPTDHAIPAVMHNAAVENGIKFIVTGGNTVSEAIMPRTWNYNANDLENLKDIHKKFGTRKLKTYPILGLEKYLYNIYVRRIKVINFLEYIDYNREKAKEKLKSELGWKDYGRKHGESLFTRFYQDYILPKRFGFDKRRAHLSTLICSGQISRKDALREIEKAPLTERELIIDKKYFIKKLGFSEDEFDEYMKSPIRTHFEFKNNAWKLNLLKSINSIMKKH